jgi:hypothetical protein
MSKLLFHEIFDGQVILRRRGVYKQAPLFHREGRVYAQSSGGFVRIGKHGSSVPGLEIEAIDGVELKMNELGWYIYGDEASVTPIRAVK